MRSGPAAILALTLAGCTVDPPASSGGGFTDPRPVHGAELPAAMGTELGPPAVRVEILPRDVLPLESVQCVAPAVDTGSDVGVWWTVDGMPYTGPTSTARLPGDTVPPNQVQSGESWSCEVIVDDLRGPRSGTASFVPEPPVGGNVLLVIVDDLGVDNVGFWFEDDPIPGHTPPATPTLDALADDGVVFRNAYSTPKCSPSRSALLTGRHGRRTGATSLMGPSSWYEVPESEVTVAELAQQQGYTTSAVGKWHMSSTVSGAALDHPATAGFDWHAGSLGNLNVTNPGDFFDWRKIVDGEFIQVRGRYATTDTADDAIDRIETMPEPWFTWVSFNAPHYPWHVPPRALTGLSEDPQTNAEMYDAAVVALDTEIGRLLDHLDPEVRDRTTIVFVSDNGTPKPVIQQPFDKNRGKFTPYEGGIHVPMIVAGPAVAHPGTSTDALVHLVDFLPSIAALTGAPLRGLMLEGIDREVALDGHSWVRQLRDPDAPGLREEVYGEILEPNGGGPYSTDDTFAQTEVHKLIEWGDGLGDEFFDKTTSHVDEGDDLMPDLTSDEEAERQRLAAWIAAKVADMPYDGPEAPADLQDR